MQKYEQHVILKGRVQSVGMRPAILRFAFLHHFTGWVCNCSTHVEICFQSNSFALLSTLKTEIFEAMPPMATISSSSFSDIIEAKDNLDSFFIKHDTAKRGVNVLSLPDLAPCAECRRELDDSTSSRYMYAFNSCAECGARGSVIRELPYERALSSWQEFPLCDECQKEYDNIESRRFRIESIGCSRCSPQLSLGDIKGVESIQLAAQAIDRGEIVALKGVGGFQLLADANNLAAIKELRMRKKRPTQPLAVMCENIETIKELTLARSQELNALASPEAPLVLVRCLELLGRAIAPNSPDTIGVMLPSSPLHILLFKYLKCKMIVATSGNGRGEPPALDGVTMAKYGLADKILDHNREIVWRHDDSIVMESSGEMRVCRRGRGYGWNLDWLTPPVERVLAMGSMYKNSFAIGCRDFVMLSPYHGNLASGKNVLAWQKAIDDSLKSLSIAPEVVVVDKHPDYYSTIYGEKLARKFGVDVVRVQHHVAHGLSAVAEANYPQALALVFDGTGLGDDGNLWGAELFFIDMLERETRRLATFRPAPLWGGECAILEPKLQYQARLDEDKYRWNAPLTHSAGRLFDAFAARLGVAPELISYEGEAAVALEYMARQELRRGEKVALLPFEFSSGEVDWRKLWRCSLPSAPALSFHYTVACVAFEMVKFGLERYPNLPIVLSGGVFQNRLLVDFLTKILDSNQIECFIPQKLPINDGAIAVGEIIGLHFKNS